jgi:hypothetical protein
MISKFNFLLCYIFNNVSLVKYSLVFTKIKFIFQGMKMRLELMRHQGSTSQRRVVLHSPPRNPVQTRKIPRRRIPRGRRTAVRSLTSSKRNWATERKATSPARSVATRASACRSTWNIGRVTRRKVAGTEVHPQRENSHQLGVNTVGKGVKIPFHFYHELTCNQQESIHKNVIYNYV